MLCVLEIESFFIVYLRLHTKFLPSHHQRHYQYLADPVHNVIIIFPSTGF